ncbi:hypothetical protein V2J09_008069 [Rumex salicifolius]
MGSSDIEQQIAAPATEEGVDNTDDEEEPGSPARHLCSPSREKISTALKFLVFKVPWYIFLILLSAFVIAVAAGCTLASPLAMMLLFSFHKNTVNLGVTATSSSSSSSSSMARIYDRSRCKETFFHRVMFSSFNLLARSGLLLLIWLVFNVSVPGLKNLKILGSPLWKWSLLAVILTSAYFVSMTVYLLPGAVQTMAIKTYMSARVFINKSGKHYSHPYLNLYSGLFPNVTLVIYFGMVLLTWLVYFRSEDGLRPASPQAIEYVTWTWVSLFVGSILLLLKKVLVLKWSANAIYRRFEPRILITGVKFVYLGLVIGCFFEDQIVSKLKLLEEYDPDRSETTSFTFTNYIMSKRLDITCLQDTGRFLASLATNVVPLKEDGVPYVVHFFENKITQTYQKCDLDCLVDLLGDSDEPYRFESKEHLKEVAGVLHSIVKEQCASDEFTFDDLKKWMVDAHKNCVNMGRTLADATAMVTRLDIFISFIISIIVVLFWLLITGIATTTVLVTIATPLLALTFIFGDSAKTFFQGIIFCFATHAYDVIDRCIVDEIEVKSIGILTTIFIKIGTNEKRMYPNSMLATKAIVNLGWQPDPTDFVELTLDFATTPAELQNLETKLEDDPEQKGLFERSHEVMIKEIGDKIKVTVYYTHVLNIKEMTHGECVKKKNKQRSILLKKINQFLDHGGVSVNSQVLPEQVPVKSWS